MKSVFVLALAACAGAASAQTFGEARLLQPGEYSLTATALEAGWAGPEAAPGVVYSGIPGPYTALTAGAFTQRDDYSAAAPLGDSNRVWSFTFVGGVAAANGVLDVFFLDTGAIGPANVVSSFGVMLPRAGDFIWTITFNPAIAPRPTIAQNGGVQIQSRTGTAGRWFFTGTAPSVGGNDVGVGTGAGLAPQRNQAFEIVTIPTPGAAALLGLAGVALARRRR
jgi:uncharacterized protein (TIGR03382 family)